MALPTASAGLLSEFCVSGETIIESEKVEIRIIIKGSAFDKDGLLQLLYIIAHEILVHGLQGIIKPSGTVASVASSHCNWSEGFMDRLVFLLVEDWIRNCDTRLPPWLDRERNEALVACQKIHEARLCHSENTLGPSGVIMRQLAINLCNKINKMLHYRYHLFSLAENITQFAFLYNAHQVSQKEREFVLRGIIRHVAYDSGNISIREKMLREMSLFVNAPDLCAFHNKIRYLLEL